MVLGTRSWKIAPYLEDQTTTKRFEPIDFLGLNISRISRIWCTAPILRFGWSSRYHGAQYYRAIHHHPQIRTKEGLMKVYPEFICAMSWVVGVSRTRGQHEAL